QLREPINAFIRWSTPLMIRGPEGDDFRADGLLVALPALLAGRMPTDRSVTVGIAVDGGMVQLRATESGIDVDRPDGRELDAVLTAEAPIVLGLAAGVLSLDDIAALVGIDGDESALRTIFDAPQASTGSIRLR
ncbi:MAG: winged helix-turn-helix transcriptional regulator, partial [Mycobacterium sp.]